MVNNINDNSKRMAISFNKNNVYTGLSKRGYGHTYFAKRDFSRGEMVMKGMGRIVDHQTSHISVQIGENRHYLPQKWTSKYWNHSCEPNTHMRTLPDGFPGLFALKKIKKGDEITYAYWMSEFKWTKKADENVIKCKCGQKKCKNQILSFSQLPKREQLKWMKSGLCSNHLLKLKI